MIFDDLTILVDVVDLPKHLNFRSCVGHLFDPIYVPILDRAFSYYWSHVCSTLGSFAGLGVHVFMFLRSRFVDDFSFDFMIFLGSQNEPQRDSKNITLDYVSWPLFGSIWPPFGLPLGSLWIHFGLL